MTFCVLECMDVGLQVHIHYILCSVWCRFMYLEQPVLPAFFLCSLLVLGMEHYGPTAWEQIHRNVLPTKTLKQVRPTGLIHTFNTYEEVLHTSTYGDDLYVCDSHVCMYVCMYVCKLVILSAHS